MERGGERDVRRSKNTKRALASLPPPCVPRDVGGTSSAPVVPPSLPGHTPGHSSAMCLRGRHPPPPTCIAAFFGGPLRGAFRVGIAMGLPPSPTRFRPPTAYSSPSSRASSIVRRTLARTIRPVKKNERIQHRERRGHRVHREEKTTFDFSVVSVSSAFSVLDLSPSRNVNHPTASGRIGRCGAGFRRRGRKGCIPRRNSRRSRWRAVRGRPP